MKSNREKVYDFIKLNLTDGDTEGLSTQYLTECLGIQRSNMSSILNILVKEGKINKSGGRPVLYALSQDAKRLQSDCFINLVGADRSLKRGVQLAKAAVLYPQNCLSTLLVGAIGTGKSFFAELMHRFAVEKGVLKSDARLITFDAKGFANNHEDAVEILFGRNEQAGLVHEAEHGTLLIENAEYLDIRTRCELIEYLSKSNTSELEQVIKHTMLIVSCDNSNRELFKDFASRIPIVIELPLLKDRSLEERMELIRMFLTLESARLRRTLRINAEVLRCLMLYDCEFNVMQLKGDIKRACANAYVRNYQSNADDFKVYIGDFEYYVRKGFLKYRAYRDEIERIIPLDYSYLFNESSMEMSEIERDKINQRGMYDALEKRITELSERGMTERDINIVISAEVENEFRRYQKELIQEVVNKEHLSRLVGEQVILLVEEFLDDAATKLSTSFPISVFYGLSLHVNAIIKSNATMNSMTTRQITEVIEHFKAEYSISLQFAAVIEAKFGIPVAIDDIVLMTMFICFKSSIADISKKPMLLFAMYGERVAQSFGEAIRVITHHDNIATYEVASVKEAETVYSELREVVQTIDRGAGVIVVYDMEFLETILDTIETELGTVIRQIKTPLTSMGLELSRRAAIDTDINSVVNSVLQISSEHKKTAIITFCTTGEGGSQELKKYIERFGDAQDMEVISLAITDSENLKDQLSGLIREKRIQCVIGPFDPKLSGIPFIPIGDVLSASKEELPLTLRLKHIRKAQIDFDEVYAYLEEQLQHVDITKLKKTLPAVIERINKGIVQMSLDCEVGLFIHIACCINRILAGEDMPENLKRDEIIGRYNRQYKELVRILKPLERCFGIIINDNEAANILTVINKL